MKKLNLLIVGHSPSLADFGRVLENSMSGKRLKKWLDYLDLYEMYNIHKVNAFSCGLDHNYRRAADKIQDKVMNADVVLVLGREAFKVVVEIKGNFLDLPHPSGLNRQLNDNKALDTKLSYVKDELVLRYVSKMREKVETIESLVQLEIYC